MPRAVLQGLNYALQYSMQLLCAVGKHVKKSLLSAVQPINNSDRQLAALCHPSGANL